MLLHLHSRQVYGFTDAMVVYVQSLQTTRIRNLTRLQDIFWHFYVFVIYKWKLTFEKYHLSTVVITFILNSDSLKLSWEGRLETT